MKTKFWKTILLSLVCLFPSFDGTAQEKEPFKIERQYVEVRDEKPINSWKRVKVTDKLYCQYFRVPPTFLKQATPEDSVVDPFAPNSSPPKAEPKENAREILEKAGITFGEGATARYYPRHSLLKVINTEDQLELVGDYVTPIGRDSPHSIYVKIEIFQLKEADYQQIQKSASNQSNHKPERDALIGASKNGIVRLVSAPAISMLPGERSQVETGRAVLQSDSVLGPDNFTMDLNVSLQFEGFKMNSRLTSCNDRYIILGAWKSKEKERHIAILYSKIQ